MTKQRAAPQNGHEADKETRYLLEDRVHVRPDVKWQGGGHGGNNKKECGLQCPFEALRVARARPINPLRIPSQLVVKQHVRIRILVRGSASHHPNGPESNTVKLHCDEAPGGTSREYSVAGSSGLQGRQRRPSTSSNTTWVLTVRDVVLIAHGRELESRKDWPSFKSVFYGPDAVIRANHPRYILPSRPD